ncbi:DUF3800 domain-containing protein [Polaromonas sp.]|uniref:DUF3800 domain-containing protein n=1 Tax=Polaromonas sp. TaxID=1869339 RepID=UPI002FC8503A
MNQTSPYVANEADAITTWFVDEAGDPALFAKGGKMVVATEGCSRFFIEGKLECRDVGALAADLSRLRAEVLADPYFKGVPSLDPARQRTAVNFHAKDDPAEVRFLVFKLLARHELRFVAVVRDKLKMLDYATQRRRIDPTYRYNPNGHELYDELTRRLFSRLHGYGEHRVVFAQRGHKPRTRAFMEAIEHEDLALEAAMGLKRPKPTEVVCGFPKDHAGLQAVDYYLWALQRFYERGETRYLEYIWPQTLEIIDLDAPPQKKRGRARGEFVVFNKEHPLTLESRAGVGNRDREI